MTMDGGTLCLMRGADDVMTKWVGAIMAARLPRERYPSYKPPKLKSSADGKCVTISSLNAIQSFKVELKDTNNVVQSTHNYSVRDGTQRVMLWREDPTLTVTINGAYLEEVIKKTEQVSTTFSANESINASDQEKYKERWQLQEFENKQAMHAWSETNMLDNTQADTPAWATQLFGSFDHKIETAVKSALDARLPPHTPGGSSEKASSFPTTTTESAVTPSPASEDTPPAWATKFLDSIDHIIEAALNSRVPPTIRETGQGTRHKL